MTQGLTHAQHPVPLEEELLELYHGQVLDGIDAVDDVQGVVKQG